MGRGKPRFVVASLEGVSRALQAVAGTTDPVCGMIVADERVGADTIIAVDVARPVSVEIAEEYFRLCPHCVAGTFAVAE